MTYYSLWDANDPNPPLPIYAPHAALRRKINAFINLSYSRKRTK